MSAKEKLEMVRAALEEIRRATWCREDLGGNPIKPTQDE